MIFAIMSARAQENHILYTLFVPDSCFTLDYHWTKEHNNAYSYSDTIKFDLNQDGIGDVFVFLHPHDAGGYMSYLCTAPQWELSFVPALTDTTTINESLNWTSNTINLSVNYEYKRFAFRHQTEDGIHYGWAFIENVAHCKICTSGFGYCTLPDTPIQWGQTELWGVEENDADGFATLHPNPTTGMVAVTGENLRQAEVVNIIGQKVFSIQGDGDELQIDLSALPAGVYFVNITDEQGHRCVRKVVKN